MWHLLSAHVYRAGSTWCGLYFRLFGGRVSSLLARPSGGMVTKYQRVIICPSLNCMTKPMNSSPTPPPFFSILMTLPSLQKFVRQSFIDFWDQTTHLPLLKPNINTYFLLWAKCKVWGWVGLQAISQNFLTEILIEQQFIRETAQVSEEQCCQYGIFQFKPQIFYKGDSS